MELRLSRGSLGGPHLGTTPRFPAENLLKLIGGVQKRAEQSKWGQLGGFPLCSNMGPRYKASMHSI